MKRKINNKGSILPIILLSVVLVQICFYSVHNVYQNQMETYHLLNEHYCSQTILALSEKYMRETGGENRVFHYNVGKVTATNYSEETILLVSLLPSGFSEEIIIKNDK